ncbi:internalin [Amycolatopsis nigrescens]|uniref:DUF7927 domain-containing protein n=1 Tax=Amycolatopsis nigrescens TaxID=381445 RepID=UPI001FDEFB2B|nr:internalin [Amycolatopsis nigrescens]
MAVASSVLMLGSGQADAATWPVEAEQNPSTFDCAHLYHSNIRSGMQFRTDTSGDATIENTVISKRLGTGLPEYWATNMAMGKDPDTGAAAAFYSSYTTGNLKLYKQVSGTGTVTDEIAGGATRDLPSGVNWGGLTADPDSGMLYGAQNGGAPKLFGMDMATGATTVWTRGQNLTSVPSNDPVFAGGTLVPDLFVDSDGGAYYGISYGGSTYVYRLDPATGTTTQAVRVTGPGSANGFNNYGMAYFNGSIYLGYYGGALYKVDPSTGVSVQVAGGNAQNNQVGRIKSESGGSWPITDLASCSVAPNLTENLVVRKSATPATAKPGDTVRYTLTVTNEGNGPATATVTDDLSGVIDDAGYNNDAVASTGGTDTPTQPGYDSGSAKLSWTGDIAPGATVTVTYSVTVGAPPGGDKLLKNTVTAPESNCAEGGTDPDCSSETPVALLKIAKSGTPDEPGPGDTVTYTVTLTNDGTADWTGATVTDDLADVLDDATYRDDATATGSDGAPAGTLTYDGAGRKLRWAGDVPQGGTVTITYSVTVDNPPGGNRRLTNQVVGPDGSTCPPGGTDPGCGTDEPVSGLVVKKSASPATVKPGDTVTYTITAENVGGAAANGVTLTDDLSGVVDDAAWNDDVTATTGSTSYDPAVAKLSWTGDIPAGQTVTINYTVTLHVPPTGDRKLRNAVTGPEGSTCQPESTDPDCTSEIPVGAVEIKKVADKPDAKPGERVTYTVTVRNTGEADYPGASFSDDLSGVLDDAAWDDNVTATTGSTSYDAGAKRLSWTGDVAKGETVTVTYSVTVGTPPAGDKRLRNLVTGPDGSTCPEDGTDPDCSTDTRIGLLELVKTADPATAKPGQRVTYTVTAHNPGTGAYPGARFTDDLSGALDDAAYNDDATATVGTVTYTEPTLSWVHDLAAGETVTITYSVTVGTPPDGDNELRNAITGPDGSGCPPGNTKPECNPVTPIAELNISKIAYPADPQPGDTITYNIQVVNDGKVKYTGAQVTDDLSGVLDDATYNNDAEATDGAVSYRAPVLTWTGDVEVDEAVNIVYTVTVHSPPQGDKRLKNVVTGTDDTNCPPGATDPDCGTDTPLPALKVTKRGSPAEIKTGDTVTYTITVENVGEADYRAASFSDDLSGVLDDATYNDDARADSGTVAFASPKLTWTGPLAKGATATITYSVTVTNAGDHRLTNVVTAPGSNCAKDSTDPDCRTQLPAPKLKITKSAEPSPAAPGGTVGYTVTVRNTGQAAYQDASFTDDLTGVLDDAVYNNDAKTTGGTVDYQRPYLSWTGTVEAGAEITIRYSVTVGRPPQGDQVLGNAVTSQDDTNCPLPEPAATALTALTALTARGEPDPDCGTETPVRSMVIAKHAEPTAVQPGDKVSYTITVTNTGKAGYEEAAFTDDLTDVLDDASYNGDVQATAGTVELAVPRLAWRGPLGVGQTVTISYSLTVKPDLTGDRHLRNGVVSSTPGANCVTGTEAGCSTDTEVDPETTPPQPPGTKPPVPPGQPDPGALADTGARITDLLIGAIVLLLAGVALRLAGSRRSS